MTNVTQLNLTGGVPTGPAGPTTVSTLDGAFQTANGPVSIKPASSGAAAATDVAMVVTLRDVNANGGATPANSAPVVAADQYSTHKEVAASQTQAVLGATGAVGDYLSHVTVFPSAVACGVVTIIDGSSTVGSFPGGGISALPDLRPFIIPIGAFSVSGAWKITTGVNVTVTGVGKFT